MSDRARTIGTGVAAAAAMLAAAGCISHENERLEIGESLRLPATGYTEAPPPGPGDRGLGSLTKPPSQSVTSLERSNWATTAILVPVDGTAHTPLYVTNTMEWTDDTRRQIGQYPTVESALDPEGDVEGQQLDAVWAPFVGVFDFFAVVPRMFVDPPWSTHWEPSEWYQRDWVTQRAEAHESAPPNDYEHPESAGGAVIQDAPK